MCNLPLLLPPFQPSPPPNPPHQPMDLSALGALDPRLMGLMAQLSTINAAPEGEARDAAWESISSQLEVLKTELAPPLPPPPCPRPVIIGLEPLSGNHVKSLAESANDPALAAQLRPSFPSPYQPADAEWFVKYSFEAAPSVFRAIVLDSCCVGVVSLELRVPAESNTFTLGYWVTPKHHGKGIGGQAVTKFMKEVLASPPPGLSRIEATAVEGNVASQRILARAGFVMDGLMKDFLLRRDGEVRDCLLFSYPLVGGGEVAGGGSVWLRANFVHAADHAGDELEFLMDHVMEVEEETGKILRVEAADSEWGRWGGGGKRSWLVGSGDRKPSSLQVSEPWMRALGGGL